MDGWKIHYDEFEDNYYNKMNYSFHSQNHNIYLNHHRFLLKIMGNKEIQIQLIVLNMHQL